MLNLFRHCPKILETRVLGARPLRFCLEKDWTPDVRFLLANGAVPTINDLSFAVLHNQLKCAEALLTASYPSPLDSPRWRSFGRRGDERDHDFDGTETLNPNELDFGIAPLFYARSTEMIDLLLQFGADPNIRSLDREARRQADNPTWTLLHSLYVSNLDGVPLERRSPEFFRHLLYRGASPCQHDSFGSYPPYRLMVDGAGIEHLEVFARHGIDWNEEHAGKNTLLHAAARRGCIPTVQYLLARHARTGALNAEGLTPLSVAKDTETMTLLCSHVESDLEISRKSSPDSEDGHCVL